MKEADQDPDDRIDDRLIPATARACRGCRRVRPVDRFPEPHERAPLCFTCSGAALVYGERPSEAWIRFPCSGCDAITWAPSRHRASRARLCVPCFRSWEEFDLEVKRRQGKKP